MLAVSLLAAAAVGAESAPAPLPEPLPGPLPAAGTTVERDLAGGAHHAWAVELAAGDFLRAVAEQRGVDVVVRLLPAGDGVGDGAGDEAIVEVDSPNGKRGPERFSYVAERAGAYRLEVRSNYADEPPGRYALTVEALRPASADDRKLAAAEAAVQRGIVDDLVVRTAESRRRAASAYAAALDLWRELGDAPREAETWNHLAFLYSRLGEVDREVEAFARHLALVRGWGGEEETARAQLNLAAAYSKQGNLDAAEPLYRQALDTFERRGDHGRVVSAWNALGSLHSRRGDLHAARDDFERALASARAHGDVRREAQVLINAGRVNNYLGHPRLAVEQLQQALRLARAEDEPRSVTAALNNLGVVYDYQGRFQEALEAHLQVLALERERGNQRGVVYALSNLGTLYNQLGRPQEARDHFLSALEIGRRTGDRAAEIGVLNSLGWSLLLLDDAAAASRRFEAALDLATGAGDRRQQVLALFRLGGIERRQGDPESALRLLERGLEISRDHRLPHYEAKTLLEIGRCLVDRGDVDSARQHLAASLEIAERLGLPAGRMAAHYEIARLERRRGRLDEARRELEAALALIEQTRGALDVIELRSSLLASAGDHHEAYVALLMQLHGREPEGGWAARAFEAAEAARSRGLLDLLREAEVDIRRGADRELLDRERELAERFNALERHRRELAAEGESGERLAAVEGELRRAHEDARLLEAQIRASSPDYAALTRPEILGAEAVQHRLLDDATALLSYSLGEEASFLWVVSDTGLESFRLPPRRHLEAMARDLYERLRSPGGGGEEAARALGEALLGPAAERVAGKRLAVVADGALHFVPFAALGDPAAGGSRPLVAGHEVVQLPSASALAVLRRDLADRPPAPHLLAVFADPVFQTADPRVSAARDARLAVAAGDGSELRGEEAGLDFRRLRFSAREASRIAALVPEEQQMLAIGFAANRQAATSPVLADYRYLHFATHGVLDARYPQLSGLVLSLVDEQGEATEGFLRLHDLYNLRLNADLVTLSACRTALGQEMRGEGLIGLTRGFMYAGAERVVASLWDVQDRATAEIMARFYRGMLEQGLSPAAALRAAQLSMSGEERWRDPYYWAPFVLQGEWR